MAALYFDRHPLASLLFVGALVTLLFVVWAAVLAAGSVSFQDSEVFIPSRSYLSP